MRLLLLRHAKSLQDASMKDRERPLNARGRGDAPRMGGYMHHRRYLPELVLCSPAKRTLETWELVLPELEGAPDVRFPDALYLASAGALERIVSAVTSDVQTLLVISHSPGLEDFARSLVRTPESTQEKKFGNDLRDKFPTCALAVLDFEIGRPWSALSRRSATLADYARPKALDED